MLAIQVNVDLEIPIHASTIRRLLPKLGVRWNRAKPSLMIPDPNKPKKMRVIRRALNKASAERPVFYVDEVDIDFNPKIGACWTSHKQTHVLTPGKNQKRYMAGALNATTGKVIYVEWSKKTSEIFLRLMCVLRRTYRQAKQIILIADN